MLMEDLDYNDKGQLELISSAVHFGFEFCHGNECEVSALLTDASAHNYLQYELDGVYQKRLRVEGGSVNAIRSWHHRQEDIPFVSIRQQRRTPVRFSLTGSQEKI